ncbi:hypothetical protein MRB53_037286 [Persea americana]|nr:hypothetical protein MRB53_037286 [Persea americana]
MHDDLEPHELPPGIRAIHRYLKDAIFSLYHQVNHAFDMLELTSNKHTHAELQCGQLRREKSTSVIAPSQMRGMTARARRSGHCVDAMACLVRATVISMYHKSDEKGRLGGKHVVRPCNHHQSQRLS